MERPGEGGIRRIMANIRMIGKQGSEAYRTIREEAAIRKYITKPITAVDVIANYGLNGPRLSLFLSDHPSVRRIPIINKFCGHSKYAVVRKAQEKGLLAPESKIYLDKYDKISEWIEKRNHSSKGYGICKARQKGHIPDKYYQKFVRDRVYELRVAAFLWIPKTEWGVFKRFGEPDKIAWNFHQGGHFSGVHDKSASVFQKAMSMSEDVLKMLSMGFGAVDFLVDAARKVYFIEVNSAPGFTDFSGHVYINAFKKLKDLPAKKAKEFGVI
jgi:hypothetical protein